MIIPTFCAKSTHLYSMPLFSHIPFFNKLFFPKSVLIKSASYDNCDSSTMDDII